MTLQDPAPPGNGATLQAPRDLFTDAYGKKVLLEIGGGASSLLISRSHFHVKGVGVRVDLRAIQRSRGVAFDGGGHTAPAFGASAFVRF